MEEDLKILKVKILSVALLSPACCIKHFQTYNITYKIPPKKQVKQITKYFQKKCPSPLIKDEQVLLFCIAIRYRSSGIGITILLWKISNNRQFCPSKASAMLMWAFQIKCQRKDELRMI